MTPHDSIPADVPTGGASVHRAIDASANRATEALRVAEDIARFALNDGFSTRLLKELRHELVGLVERISPAASRIHARDTDGDVGTEIAAPDEYDRGSIPALAASNLRRAQQAVRSLEEFAKLSRGDIAAQLEALRYRLYSLEVPLTRTLASRERLADCTLCVLTDGRTEMDKFRDLVEQLVSAGASMIQLRDKGLTDLELWERANALVQLTRSQATIAIINDRADIAASVGADGVHLGQSDLPISAARRILPAGALVGVSTHSIDQARQAIVGGADYLGVGPVFPSRTKAFHKLAGLELVHAVVAETGLPCFAIGGITQSNLAEVLEAGATRVAVSGAVLTAESPGAMVRVLAEQLNRKQLSSAAAHA